MIDDLKKFSFNEKMRLLKKLYDNGIRTEDDLKKIGLNEIVRIKQIKRKDFDLIVQLQEQVKRGRLYSFLGEEECKQKELVSFP